MPQCARGLQNEELLRRRDLRQELNPLLANHYTGDGRDFGWAEMPCIARIVQSVLSIAADQEDVLVVDGKYGPVDHSWLVIPCRDSKVILDPYAVGRLPMVQLVSPALGLHGLYCPSREQPLLNEPGHEWKYLDKMVIERELRKLAPFLKGVFSDLFSPISTRRNT